MISFSTSLRYSRHLSLSLFAVFSRPHTHARTHARRTRTQARKHACTSKLLSPRPAACWLPLSRLLGRGGICTDASRRERPGCGLSSLLKTGVGQLGTRREHRCAWRDWRQFRAGPDDSPCTYGQPLWTGPPEGLDGAVAPPPGWRCPALRAYRWMCFGPRIPGLENGT